MNSADYREEGCPEYLLPGQRNRNGVFDRAGGNAGQINLYSKARRRNDGYSRGLFCCFFLMLVLCRNVQAQDSSAFDKVYDEISKEIAPKNLPAALAAADSLHKASHKVLFRIRSMMLIARLYQQKEDIEKSIEYAQKLEKLAGETGNYAWQARANGYLAGLYRMTELYNKAREYSEKALEIIPKIADPEQANNTRGLMLQELAFSNMDGEHNRKAIEYLKAAEGSFNKLKAKRDFLLRNNERLLGDNYRTLKSYDTALIHYNRAEALSAGIPDDYITGLLYKGMAETELENGNLPRVKHYLDKAEQVADASQYLQIKEAIYALSKKYYAKIKDSEKLAAAREKKDSVTGELLDKRAELLDKTYSRLEQRSIKAEQAGNIKTGMILAAVLLLISGAAFFVWYHRKKHLQLAQFETILEQLRKKENGPAVQETSPVVEEHRKPMVQEPAAVLPPVTENPKHRLNTLEKRIMPEETERRLLKGLEDFQQSDLFLDSELSFSSLATRLNTNTKYLSYLIKVHKKTDFTSYINELRVNYIVEKLKNNPEWRHYKISALAVTAGFSSHSQFAAVFKTFTGLTPSVFVKYLEKLQEQ
ncbi:helix-turn-helix domain-containing protein [Niabella pedocola]|uniref:Helix-turn-helix domain-containing protein n=1 Tax=Niabella pedocola TaxID=1752077 RepID=A0ABS8PN36_9BACT|nr:helix-turn-helix domain-containing protein [Niabella pedocola]MCD2422514.1 helix-turn-helix domain-containing protein [Niabella pedocola]